MIHPTLAVTRPDVTLSRCTLTVHDLAEALDFYQAVLGFDARTDVTHDGQRSVTVGPPSQPGMRILLRSSDGSPHATGRVVFQTTDCDGIFTYLEAAGADVMQEPIDQPHGARECVFADPSGNMLHFTQRRPMTSRGVMTGWCVI